MNKTYQNAFTEVYEILNYLEEESYNKIPKEVIEAIRENRNLEYYYFIDESIPFAEQKMLPETKAILFNLYRDYLTTKERKNKIIMYQNQELRIEEIFSIVLISSKPNSGCLCISLLKSIKKSFIEFNSDSIKSLLYILFIVMP